MKKLSKSEQRKLYQMFEEVVDNEIGLRIQNNLDWGNFHDSENIREKAKKKKENFLSFLENNLI